MLSKLTLALEGLGKVIPIRLKRLKNQGRTQHNLTTAYYEGDSSGPTDLYNPIPAPILSSTSLPVYAVSASSKPGLQEPPTEFPSTVYSWGASPARETSDIVQVALPLIQAFTGVIPLVGAPMNAAIGGLLGILRVINRCDQNKAALVDLNLQLYRLFCHLCNAPPPLDPLKHSRIDLLARKLQDTSARPKGLQKRRLAYTSITQAITGCSSDINRYLMECLLSSQMQSQCGTHELYMIFRRRQEGSQNIQQSSAVPSALHLAGAVVLGCVIFVDATGHNHTISSSLSVSFQHSNNMLRLLFGCDAIEAQIQKRYIEGDYDLCINKGTQVTRLTSDKWSSIDPGTNIATRAILQYQGWTVCSTDCRECKRRFQITHSRMEQSTRSSNSDTNHIADTEMRLIRNFHVQQIPVCNIVFRAS